MAQKEPQGLPILAIKGLQDQNEVAHHTAKYETPGLILRRGQTFRIEIDLKRAYKEDEDRFDVKLETGKNPRKRNGTLAVAEHVKDFSKMEWGYKLLKCCGTTLELEINIPPDCLVSKYKMSVEVLYKQKSKRRTIVYYYDHPVYILFNAWCLDDEVYMEDDAKREEYVLNDHGYVFCAGRRPRPWYFGQFEDATLTCVMELLERVRTNLRDTAREVARNISALANDFDDDGILTGNWSGDYDTGTKPWEWNGSVKIFKKFVETGKPVHYGQCWVFSGIVTSLMRSLGIPTRSVTNYDSAHDTDNNLTFDKYFNEKGEYLDDMSDDSCWNFHVWNESWMSRPDLPAGYGGWQAFDATPQEESHGKYRTGPASVRAIKEGKVKLKYDTKFIFAEVNSDKVYWQFNKETDDYEPVQIDSDAVGHWISTKSVGFASYFGSQREDITLEYKYPEGSTLERIAVRQAMKAARNPAVKERPKDLSFEIEAPEEITRGDEITVVLKLKNSKDQKLSVDVSLTSQIVRYTGVALKKLKIRNQKVDVAAKKESKAKFVFTASEYSSFMDEDPMLRFTVMAKVESGQTFAKQTIVSINKPDLDISVVSGSKDKKVKPGSTIKVKVELNLPSDLKQLSNCELSFDGSALDSPLEFKVPDTKGPRLSVQKDITIKKITKDRKEVQLNVTLSAKEITGLQGTLALQLEK